LNPLFKKQIYIVQFVALHFRFFYLSVYNRLLIFVFKFLYDFWEVSIAICTKEHDRVSKVFCFCKLVQI